MTAAFTGGLAFSRLNISTSPNAYEAIEEVKSLSGLGKTNPLIDSTSFDSTSMEYIAGLADGSEITVECLRVHTASSAQNNLVTDVDDGTTSAFQLVLTDASTSPNLVKTYTFNAVCLSWSISPSYTDANGISFTLKITGSITVA
jgi:hypothetical protein